jgi:hypothetical protein
MIAGVLVLMAGANPPLPSFGFGPEGTEVLRY